MNLMNMKKLKIKKMKKILVVLVLASIFSACTFKSAKTETVQDDTTAVVVADSVVVDTITVNVKIK